MSLHNFFLPEKTKQARKNEIVPCMCMCVCMSASDRRVSVMCYYCPGGGWYPPGGGPLGGGIPGLGGIIIPGLGGIMPPGGGIPGLGGMPRP
mmetsp:Transcript_5714/g.14715  ORF Transcript_5714/g.14715 Transcript_5714/m.14715 type:complete len:92 (+) Transcript_5714:100-375(+)